MVTGDSVSDDGVLRIARTADPPGLAIAGEIDESTYPVLLAALRELPDTPPEVHLDLADVSYCDLAGLRAIVRLASPGGASPGRPVVLHKVPAQLRAVLEIIGWDAIPGLSVAEPG
jgi:ABC-type transporter Mla MlaB component